VIRIIDGGPTQVWLSTGAAFAAPRSWGSGNLTTDQIADVNGDGRADIVEFAADGAAYVKVSTGSAFSGASSLWGMGNSVDDRLADVNGDKRADVIDAGDNGSAIVRLSAGDRFGAWSTGGPLDSPL